MSRLMGKHMNRQGWQRYVAGVCSDVWGMDHRETDEVTRCIQALIAADGIEESSEVQVFMSIGVGGGVGGRGGMRIRIQPAHR